MSVLERIKKRLNTHEDILKLHKLASNSMSAKFYL